MRALAFSELKNIIQKERWYMLMKIGTKIRNLREKTGLSKERLAEFLDIDHDSLSEIENNKIILTLGMLSMVSSLFGVTISELLSKDEPRNMVNYDFAKNNLTVSDLKSISEINKIILNANLMSDVLKAD